MSTDRTAQLGQLVAGYRDVLDGLLEATADLDDASWRRATGCPGWDVHDQLAHCVGLERRLLGDADRDPDVEVPDLPHLTGEVGRYIERDVQARRGVPHAELVREAQEAFGRRVTQLGAITPDELTEETTTFFGPMRLASWLRMRVFDLASHERDIRAAVGRLDGLDGAHVPGVVEHVLRAWARTLPRRLEAADTVRFDIVGDEPADLDLGSGALTRGAGVGAAAASGSLRLTPAQALALAGGRTDAPELDDLAPEGDRELLTRFVALAGVTP